MTSLENIAASTNQSVDFISNDLQKMIKSRFFSNAKIDSATNEIIIGGKQKSTVSQAHSSAKSEEEAYTCPGCDATGNKPKGTRITCDYCGTEI